MQIIIKLFDMIYFIGQRNNDDTVSTSTTFLYPTVPLGFTNELKQKSILEGLILLTWIRLKMCCNENIYLLIAFISLLVRLSALAF